jgi:serine/threonine-protein kinase
MGFAAGDRLGRYEILSPVGAGGMGEVYRARDASLDREVAVKVLPEAVATDLVRLERFEREAKAVAALSHPNILEIYDFGQHAEVHYAVTELLEGETLRERIPTSGLPWQKVVEIGTGIADGVAAAHAKGIVHRDLKPENVFITADGRVKVLDFGLARLEEAADSEAETGTFTPGGTEMGTVMGTVGYMAPEQVRGERADARSDIFALGCVLYEMVSGQRAFAGDTGVEMMAAILKEEPPQLSSSGALLPAELERSIHRCLEKSPEARYQSAADLAYNLRSIGSGSEVSMASRTVDTRTKPSWTSAAVVGGLALAVVTSWWALQRRAPVVDAPAGEVAPAEIRSLAVLPLDNLSGDPDQEYFSDGMTQALITDLSKIGALKVISRSSVMPYKGTEKSLPEIAAELNVDAVVEGSVQREGDRVRVTAQLIEAATDRHLWAERYEREVTSVFALQSDVAQAIAREVRVSLTPQEEVRLASTREVNPETYEAYLRGMFYLNQRTPEGLHKGLAILHEAIEKDPADPMAYAGLALGYVAVGHRAAPPKEAFPRAKAAALRALELEADLAEAELALAAVMLYHEWDWQGAEKAFLRAIELNPSLAMAHYHYAWYLELVGRGDQALEEGRRAQELDPLTLPFTAWLGGQYWRAGRYDEALAEAKKSLDLDPDFSVGWYVAGLAYEAKGMNEEAIEAQEKAAAADPTKRWALGEAYAHAGRMDEAWRIANELEAEATPRQSLGLIRLYKALGDKDAAFRWVEAAYEYRLPFFPWLVSRSNPRRGEFEEDPRMQELARRINLPAS